jgi:hypothetical protein
MKTSQTEKSAQSITTLTPEEMKQVSGGIITPIFLSPFQAFVEFLVARSFRFTIG